MARNRKVIPLLSAPFYQYNAVFSPDGKWLAFLSTESGHAEVYMQALDRGNDSLRGTGERFLISPQVVTASFRSGGPQRPPCRRHCTLPSHLDSDGPYHP